MQFERALDRALTTLASDAVTGADVARARDKVRRAIAETWNDTFEAAHAVCTALAAARSLHALMAWGAPVAAVTPGPAQQSRTTNSNAGVTLNCFSATHGLYHLP